MTPTLNLSLINFPFCGVLLLNFSVTFMATFHVWGLSGHLNMFQSITEEVLYLHYPSIMSTLDFILSF